MFTKEHQEGIRALGPNAEDAYLNIEPEYIAVDSQSKYAYVTLQEVSAIAKVDIAKGQIVRERVALQRSFASTKCNGCIR